MSNLKKDFPYQKKNGKLQLDLCDKSNNNIKLLWEKMSLVVRNGVSATGFDIFSLRELDTEIQIDEQTYKYIFVATQIRSTEGDKILTYDEVKEAYDYSQQQFSIAKENLGVYLKNNPKAFQKYYEIFSNCLLVLVVVSNRSYEIEKEGDAPEGCLIICRENFEQYFGILTDLNLCVKIHEDENDEEDQS